MKAKTSTILSFLALMCVVLLSACSKDNDTPSMSIGKSEISLNSKQTETIVVSPSAAGCTFTTENKYIANVSADGKVTPITVGTTYITVSNSTQNFSERCKVTVTPLLNLFKEPYLSFGATKATVKANENRTLATETSTGLGFTGENSNVTLVMYVFDKQGKMISAAIAFPTSKMYTTMDFLAERYIPIGYENGYGVFMSNDEKMGVGITVYNTSYLMIVYAPVSSSKAASTDDTVQQQMIELMDSHFGNR